MTYIQGILPWPPNPRCLRILCALPFIPHIWAKIFARPITLGFFEAAGYRPALAFLYLALVVESITTICLLLGVFIFYAATGAAIFMLVAALSVLKVSRGKWLWNLGGCEYHIFWAAACTIVALYA